MKTCPDCKGRGQVQYIERIKLPEAVDEPLDEWANLRQAVGPCKTCEGDGYVPGK